MSTRSELLQELYYALALPGTPRWTTEHVITPEFAVRLEAHVRVLLALLLEELPHG